MITYLIGVAPSVVSLFLTIIIKVESYEKIDEELIKNQDENNEEDKLVERYTITSQKNEND